MSALAQIEESGTVVPELHLAEANGLSVAQMQVNEMNRWMVWFGVPVS